MAKITYIEHCGTEHTIEVANGISIMEAAMKAGIPGIDGDCGGACSCGTCMVFVPETWWGMLPDMKPMEKTILQFCDEVAENSRLSCQLVVSDELEGIRVTMPENQY
ncbi:MAG: 2Fe-2S ferredoxin [Alphaproteobacteria bacterium HGW-Alphaproteobacteria-12]|nr:MAG: 2Fe-2S ferredoxin [Alphaproteobacteria bacterium HGW-Alphaproteobacteria-12]